MSKQYTCTECGKKKTELKNIGAHLQSHHKGLKKSLWHLYIKELDCQITGSLHKKKKKPKVKSKPRAKSFKSVLSPKFYNSKEWRKLRYQVIVKHGNNCMACGSSPLDGIVIHVDHIKPRSLYPELALDINNLQILCADCNMGKSNIDATDWRIDEELKDMNTEMDNEFSDIVKH